MKAKDFVLQHMPNARAERQVQRGAFKGAGKPYWLIRDGKNTSYFVDGTSESNAWVNAKERIIENLVDDKETSES